MATARSRLSVGIRSVGVAVVLYMKPQYLTQGAGGEIFVGLKRTSTRMAASIKICIPLAVFSQVGPWRKKSSMCANRSTAGRPSSSEMMMHVKFYSTLLQSNILDFCSCTRGRGGNTPSKATHTDSLCYSSQGDVHYVRSSSPVSVALVPILQSSYAIVSGDGSGGWVVRGKYRCRRVWTWGS